MAETYLTLLWARLGDGSRYPAQFVAAFCEGEVECWADLHAQRRNEAEKFYADFVGVDDEGVTEFFTTTLAVERPAFPVAPAPQEGES
jgi:hypothetical protein